MPGYHEDLAYIHDAGFKDYALNAAPGLLQILRKNGVTDGLVRVSVGIEDWRDLLADFEQALAA